MATRAEQKRESREKILSAAGKRIRAEGLNGAGVAAVMKDAGLTHGAFYSHFETKDDLARAALSQALHQNRQDWMKPVAGDNWGQRLERLAKRYLTQEHIEHLDESCALAALGSEAGRADHRFKQAYEKELTKSLAELCGEGFDVIDVKQQQEALAFMSLMVGSITLARAVDSDELAERLLQAGCDYASKISD